MGRNLRALATPPERDISAIPKFNVDWDHYASKGLITVQDLFDLKTFDDEILVIDFRSHEDYFKDSISLFKNVVNIQPNLLSPTWSFEELVANPLCMRYPTHRSLLKELDKFNLVVVTDEFSNAQHVSSSMLYLIKMLKSVARRTPVLLEGGMSQCHLFLNGADYDSHIAISADIITGNEEHFHNSGNNYSFSNYNYSSSISRSPSPIRGKLKPIDTSNMNLVPIGPTEQKRQKTHFNSSSRNNLPLLYNKVPMSQPVSQPITLLANSKNSTIVSPKPLYTYNSTLSSMVTPISTPDKTSTDSPIQNFKICSGLKNLGNSCYMNSAIQCLILTPLTQFLLKTNYLQYVPSKSKLGTHGQLTQQYQQLLLEMSKNTPNSTNPSLFKKVLAKSNSQFANSQQQDSAEFLHFLLDTIHEDLNMSANKPTPKQLTADEEKQRELLPIRLASTIEWEKYLVNNYSTIIETFAGQYASKLQCGSCKSTSTTFIPFTMLSLPLPTVSYSSTSNSTNIITIYDCLNKFISPENMRGDDAWKCSHCNLKIFSTKTLQLTRLPTILIIHLERFRYNNSFKLIKDSRPVVIPKRLEMGNFWPKATTNELQQLNQLPKRGQEGDWHYSLKGIVRHWGNMNGGHYVSDVKLGSKEKDPWVRFDDEKWGSVKETAEDGSAYVLIYERVE